MFRRNVLASVSVLALTVAANAADIYVPSPAAPGGYKDGPWYPSWTGLYIGGHGGADWFNNDWFVPNTPINVVGGCTLAGCNVSAGSNSGSSWLGGVQVGYNYQISRMVVGVEAEYSWTDLKGSNIDPNIPNIRDHSTLDSFGITAGRLGTTWGASLLYLKGGGAWTNEKFFTSTAACSPCQSETDTRWGWMAGIGWEYAFSRDWSAKIEYNHLDFGNERETVRPAVSFVFPFQYDIKQSVDLVKVGINYHLLTGYVPLK